MRLRYTRGQRQQSRNDSARLEYSSVVEHWPSMHEFDPQNCEKEEGRREGGRETGMQQPDERWLGPNPPQVQWHSGAWAAASLMCCHVPFWQHSCHQEGGSSATLLSPQRSGRSKRTLQRKHFGSLVKAAHVVSCQSPASELIPAPRAFRWRHSL
jgi:hypothetical protein